MTRRLASLFILTVIFVAVLAIGSYASSKADGRLNQIQRYGFTKATTDISLTTTGKNTSTTSLGAFSADGGSPGYITGRTYQDRVNWFSPGNTVGWAHTPNIHFAIGAQPLGGDDDDVSAKWTEYTMFDPTTAPNGVWQTPVMLHTDPFNYNGKMHQLAVDETGHALIEAMVTRTLLGCRRSRGIRHIHGRYHSPINNHE
jgi:hypothetical protein